MTIFSLQALTKKRLTIIALFGLTIFLLIGGLAGQGLARQPRPSVTMATPIIKHSKTAPIVERISGSNAINTSVAVSKKYYSPGVDVAYVVNRSAFADGIVASSMKASGPVLYTNSDRLPSAIASELNRLKPKRVIIIGGSIVVSDKVLSQIKTSIPSSSKLERLSGSNRYQTAVNVSKADYPSGSNIAYIANGTAYADALIATQQASDGPLLYSSDTSIRSAVINELKRLNPKEVIIIGGSSVVGQNVADTIAKNIKSKVSRISGQDRYSTAAALSKQLYPNGSQKVFIANGTAYADSILIGSIPVSGSMLYVSDRITDATMTELQRLRASEAVIIGGPIRVSNPVSNQVRQIMSGAQAKQRLARGVSYFVLAHPDDELASWAAIEASEYPVFILATQGEASRHCIKHGGKGSQLCRDLRLKSFHQFLDNYYSVTDHGMQPGGFQLFKGPDSARLIFDLGDGSLTQSKVTFAINRARSIKYPVAQDNYVISGNYWDDKRDPNCKPGRSDYACGLYNHPDHRASYNAVRAYPHPNKMTFHGHYNPMVTAGVVMSKQKFESMIACPNGTYNKAYGWLNPPCWTRENSRWDHWQWMREY